MCGLGPAGLTTSLPTVWFRSNQLLHLTKPNFKSMNFELQLSKATPGILGETQISNKLLNLGWGGL